MSHEARPISPVRFASALEELPLANLYSKAFEIRNSIAHLQRSNEELQTYSDSQPGGDTDCLDAVRENEFVIGRMRERVEMVKKEVENRGGRWHEADPEVDGVDHKNNDEGFVGNGHTDTVMNGDQETHEDADRVNDAAHATHPEGAANSGQRQAGGRLNDEELRRRMLGRMSVANDDGMHL